MAEEKAEPEQCSAQDVSEEARRSEPGRYQGYSPELYSEWVRSSFHVPVRDGTKLALTLYRPAVNGRAVDARYPVALEITPYRARYRTETGAVAGQAESSRASRPMVDLTRYGYVVAVLDIRGKGASFGARRGFQDRTEAQDAYDIIEYLADQPWSSGAVGMWGCSYNGGTQLQAASVAPPSLRAIFTGGSDYDKFNFVRRGGILAQFNTRPDEPPEWDLAAVPVDADADGALLREAAAQHANNTPMAPLWTAMPHRDSVSPHVGTRFWEEVGLYRYERTIERSGVAIYHWHNMDDEGRGEGVIAAANLSNPGRLLIGPGGHCEPPPNFDLFAEHLRFFDRYLKGIRNGFENGPRVTYWTLGEAPGAEWTHSDAWRAAPVSLRALHLARDGAAAFAPAAAGQTSFRVNYDVKCDGDSYFIFGPCVIDASGATFTTAPLEEDMQVAGNPNAYVWLSSSVDRANLFVYLEEVAPDGKVDIVTHGRLAAAYRRVSPAPYDTLGQPWHSGLASDQESLAPGQIVEMAVPLLPTSKIFRAGSRIRITLAGADPRQRNLAELRTDPAPTLTIHLGPDHPSRVELPIAPVAQMRAALRR
jgi:predicted acyl esterase